MEMKKQKMDVGREIVEKTYLEYSYVHLGSLRRLHDGGLGGCRRNARKLELSLEDYTSKFVSTSVRHSGIMEIEGSGSPFDLPPDCLYYMIFKRREYVCSDGEVLKGESRHEENSEGNIIDYKVVRSPRSGGLTVCDERDLQCSEEEWIKFHEKKHGKELIDELRGKGYDSGNFDMVIESMEGGRHG